MSGFPFTVAAETLRIAVASNFAPALRILVLDFEQASGHKIKISTGSTGKHYAQIKQGAPFDLFLAADVKRPALLEQDGEIVSGTRFTYALGKLVLWSPDMDLVDAEAKVLQSGKFKRIAIANPKLAPYGKAAQEVLEAKGLWTALRRKMVRGENIGQTFQFVKTENAQLGFVALAQVYDKQGSRWQIPESLYAPIVQQGVLLNDTPAGRSFIAYLQSATVQNRLQRLGYISQ